MTEDRQAILQELNGIHHGCWKKCGCEKCLEISEDFLKDHGITRRENYYFLNDVYVFPDGDQYFFLHDCEHAMRLDHGVHMFRKIEIFPKEPCHASD